MPKLSWISRLFDRQEAVPASQGLRFGRELDGAGSICLDDSVIRNHVYISGKSGTGSKTLVEQLLTQQTERGRGWLYIDPTSDQALLDRLTAAAQEHGRGDEFFVLDLAKPEDSHCYDILRAGAPEARARRVLELLMAAEDTETAHLQSFLSAVLAAVDAAGFSVGLIELFTVLRPFECKESLDQLLTAAPESLDAHTRLAMNLAKKFDLAAQPELACVLSHLVAKYRELNFGDLADVLNSPEPEICFSDILAHNKMCYVRLPILDLGADKFVALTRMVVLDITHASHARLSTPKRLRSPFLLVMDWFPKYGLFNGFRSQTYSQARGLNLAILPVAGSDDHVARNESELEAELVLDGNTYTKVFFQQKQSRSSEAATRVDNLALGEFVMQYGSTQRRGHVAPAVDVGKPLRAPRRAMLRHVSRPRFIST